MKLDKFTLDVLSNFQSINPSIKIDAGNVLLTTSKTKAVLARAKVPNEFPVTFSLYELNKFLRVLSLFKEPEIEFSEKFLTIIEGKTRMKYGYCDPQSLIVPLETPGKRINPELIFTEFQLGAEVFAQSLKAMSVLSHSGLSFVGEDGKLLIKTVNDKSTQDVFIVEIGETDKEFNIIMEAEKLAIINGEYKVSILRKKFAYFESEKLEYWIAAHLKSVINE